MPYSYRSLYDVMNPDGDYNIFPFIEYANKLHLSKKKLFHEFGKIDRPTLVVYGELDDFCYGRTKENIEILKKHTGHPHFFTFKMIQGADHGFSGHQNTLIQIISDWLG